MELLIKQHNNGEISFNADELKAQIAAFVAQYDGLVYTPDNIKESKKDRTEVRRAITAIDDRRKEVKRAYMDGYNKFEKEVKECLAPLVELEAELKTLADEYEKTRQEEKMEQIKEIFADIDYPISVPLEAVYRAQWLNVSFSLKDIKQEMLDFAVTIRQSMDVLNRLPNSFEAIEVYKQTFDLAKAINEADRIAEIQKKKEEAEKAKSESAKKERQAEIASIPTEKLVEAVFVVRTSISRLKQLKAYMDENGIVYEG